MREKSLLLVVDGIVNLALGILLIIFPTPVIAAFDLPKAENNFYINILGAVLFGIGIALFIERISGRLQLRGLGIAGAIAVNLCGSGALIAWLTFGHLELSTAGKTLLWGIALVVLGVALIEIFSNSWKEYE